MSLSISVVHTIWKVVTSSKFVAPWPGKGGVGEASPGNVSLQPCQVAAGCWDHEIQPWGAEIRKRKSKHKIGVTNAYIYIHTYIYIHIYIYISKSHMYLYVCVYANVNVYVMYLRTCVCVCVRVYMGENIFLCMGVCIGVFVYIHTYIHTCVYMSSYIVCIYNVKNSTTHAVNSL
jgi:hypothetical protein